MLRTCDPILRGVMNMGRYVVLLLLIAVVSGCGYSNQPLYRSTVRTVYVDLFQSKEFRRGIEFQLTEALRKRIDLETPYKNTRREKADTILAGEVLEWREATIGRDFITDRPRETAATLAVRYRWQDMRTGKIIVEKPMLVTTVQYVRPVGETVFNAREDAVNKIAEKMVETMQTGW